MIELPRWLRPETLLPDQTGTVLIVGPPDSGKSTLADHLFNSARARHLPVAWIDADPGQTRLGLPACIWGASSDGQVSCGAFIGSLTPSGYEVEFGNALVRLKTVLKLEGAELIIIDSPGFVFGSQAHEFQRTLLGAAMPNYLIALDGNGSLRELLDVVKFPSAIRLPRLPGSHRRPLEARIRRQRSLFDRHVGDAHVSRFSYLDSLCWMKGIPVNLQESGNLIGHIAAFVGSRMPLVVQIEHVRDQSSEMDLLVPADSTPTGPLVIGNLLRSWDGSLRHDPNLSDPRNVQLHFGRSRGGLNGPGH
jgi:polynucleotide 5'-kinase involved in rRNA processing